MVGLKSVTKYKSYHGPDVAEQQSQNQQEVEKGSAAESGAPPQAPSYPWCKTRVRTNTVLVTRHISCCFAFFCLGFKIVKMRPVIFFFSFCFPIQLGVSVSVSTFSLVAISLERYSAICKPLQSRVWQTKTHALKVIAATWCLSFVIMTPYPIYSTLVPSALPNSTTSKCRLSWPSTVIEQSW